MRADLDYLPHHRLWNSLRDISTHRINKVRKLRKLRKVAVPMGVYSVITPYELIYKKLSGCKTVTIVGCAACANDSIGITDGCALSKVVGEDGRVGPREEPIAVIKKAKQLQEYLKDKGIDVNIIASFGLCMLSYEREHEASELVEICKNSDSVITLSCVGGNVALRLILPEDFIVVSGMKTMGVFQICKIFDEDSGLVYADGKKSQVFRFVRDRLEE
jgi:hypothetical protein